MVALFMKGLVKRSAIDNHAILMLIFNQSSTPGSNYLNVSSIGVSMLSIDVHDDVQITCLLSGG
jgi:hypothetical protein